MRVGEKAAEASENVVLAAGDFYFGGGRTRISTLLGSCVSITLWHPRRRIGGMCHCMMAGRERAGGAALDARYADEAFALFLQHVEAAATRPCEYQAKLFGGARMFADEAGGRVAIGERNIDCAQRLLAASRITLVSQHIGGSGRRKLHFDLWSGDVWLAFPDGKSAQVRSLHG